MSRLKTTFEALRVTSIESAVDLLILALDDADATVRGFALRTLVARGDARSAAKILENWNRLQPADIALLREQSQAFAGLIAQHLVHADAHTPHAIEAADQLELTSAILPLITLAESSISVQIKRRAAEVVLDLVRALGCRARQNRDLPTVRGPVVARLVDAVYGFAMHRNEKLVDAFLEASAWQDGDLRLLLEKPSPTRDLICQRWKKTFEPGAMELLAGFIRRRDLPTCVGRVIQTRSDEQFRDILLKMVGSETSNTVQKNLQAIGLPRSCQGGERLVNEAKLDQLSAIIHLYVSACSDEIEKLQVVAAAAQRGGEVCMAAAAIGLSHCKTPDADFWMRAAVPVADGNLAAIANNENARLLHRLIKLLKHSDGALVRSVQQVLSPLHADNIVYRMETLRPRSRRRLGKVIMMVDANAIARIQDALRHPVLSRRLDAIALAEAIACVDQLVEPLAHIVREDHQDARIRVAEIMGDATSQATFELLEELTLLPHCGVRDAALESLEKRRKSVERTP